MEKTFGEAMKEYQQWQREVLIREIKEIKELVEDFPNKEMEGWLIEILNKKEKQLWEMKK